ncbi:fimbria/pilus periplasmic chaperone [Paucibacter sp. O1-1]|uniref:fimbrial biogenesis chaperone n=1 Tax=Paucibacter sp. M5-1 TaxID=3015998 RepID=UPI0010F7D674|nr:fimbria/pilus periplasmic chaperone [Paucibacter sp. M5-1]MCU7373421.1 fimbria/pilus periplasmic chaperone [Paucibacter sp. O1-1]MCZ7879714.1 fimbria/pilus periplasmic chaperone [Paucibacter sp. M5-1]MDA3828421.1 fimbria/pilus periplasmic chaperone [Paucibacter sp. O1-1]
MRTALLACLLALSGLAHAADISLMPVNVKLDRLNDRATVQVQNNGSEAVIMQADAIAWTRVQGQDVDGPTSDIIVNPPIFTIQPGQTQIVRVGLRRNQELQQEATYRMVLREVPSPRLSDIGNVSGSVRVLVALRVPVYVAPSKIVRQEQWQLRRDATGEMVASVSNTGNVHLKIGELRLQGGAALALQGSGSVIFPGEQRSFRLQGGQKHRLLEVVSEQGVQQVALNEAQD